MSYFDDNEDYLIHRLGHNSFKRKPARQRVVVTADDFEDLTQPSVENLLRKAVYDATPFYSPRGSKHGEQWCWFCGKPKLQYEPEAKENHKSDCTWLNTRRLLCTEDLA